MLNNLRSYLTFKIECFFYSIPTVCVFRMVILITYTNLCKKTVHNNCIFKQTSIGETFSNTWEIKRL